MAAKPLAAFLGFATLGRGLALMTLSAAGMDNVDVASEITAAFLSGKTLRRNA